MQDPSLSVICLSSNKLILRKWDSLWLTEEIIMEIGTYSGPCNNENYYPSLQDAAKVEHGGKDIILNALIQQEERLNSDELRIHH